MASRVIIDSEEFLLTIDRLCYQLIENHNDFSNTILIGVQPRGGLLSRRLAQRINELLPKSNVRHGLIDPTFHRDDFRRHDSPILATKTELDYDIEKQSVVLIDDVFFTGRTIRAAMDAIMDFGRPDDIELLVLIDRRFSRHLPIQPTYVGKRVDSVASEKVKVSFSDEEEADGVIILPSKSKQG